MPETRFAVSRGDTGATAILLLFADLDPVLELSGLNFGGLCRRRRRFELRRRSLENFENDDSSKDSDDRCMNNDAYGKRPQDRLLALADKLFNISGGLAHRAANFFSSGWVMKVTDSILATAHSLRTSMILWYFVFLAVRMVITVADLLSSEIAL